MLGQKQAEEAIVPTAANEVEHGGGKEEGEEADVGEQPQNSVFQMKTSSGTAAPLGTLGSAVLQTK